MRKYVGVLAVFGVIIGLMAAGGYIYLLAYVPTLQIDSPHYLVFADSLSWAQGVEMELGDAVSRFRVLFGNDQPAIRVAVTDGRGQMNALIFYLALRREFGTAPEELMMPYPTPRLAAEIAQVPASAMPLAQDLQSLDHEAGHWLLALYAEKRYERHEPEEEKPLPDWLCEGVAGFCESAGRRRAHLPLVREALSDTARYSLLPLDSLLAARLAVAVRGKPPLCESVLGFAHASYPVSTLFVAQSALLIEYCEAERPGMIRALVDHLLEGGGATDLDPQLASQHFTDWVRSQADDSI